MIAIPAFRSLPFVIHNKKTSVWGRDSVGLVGFLSHGLATIRGIYGVTDGGGGVVGGGQEKTCLVDRVAP